MTAKTYTLKLPEAQLSIIIEALSTQAWAKANPIIQSLVAQANAQVEREKAEVAHDGGKDVYDVIANDEARKAEAAE